MPSSTDEAEDVRGGAGRGEEGGDSRKAGTREKRLRGEPHQGVSSSPGARSSAQEAMQVRGLGRGGGSVRDQRGTDLTIKFSETE